MRRLELFAWAALAALLLCGGGCTAEPDYCRFDPSCAGGIGAFCDRSDECRDGFCCRDGNCGGGMCTYRCDADAECPPEMACEHGVCFFSCRSDADCARGMSCEHGNTVCEWN